MERFTHHSFWKWEWSFALHYHASQYSSDEAIFCILRTRYLEFRRQASLEGNGSINSLTWAVAIFSSSHLFCNAILWKCALHFALVIQHFISPLYHSSCTLHHKNCKNARAIVFGQVNRLKNCHGYKFWWQKAYVLRVAFTWHI